jgi:hypothetical protein
VTFAGQAFVIITARSFSPLVMSAVLGPFRPVGCCPDPLLRDWG